MYGFKSKEDISRVANATRKVEGEYSSLRKFGKSRRNYGSKQKSEDVQAYYCMVTGKVGALYSVSLHLSPDTPSIGTGTALPLMLKISETVPVGTWFIGVATTIIGMAVK